MATQWTVNSIKAAARTSGSHWFDPDTMRSFGTEVLPSVYQGRGGVFFVTKDDQYRRELPKRFTVRQFDPADASIGTYSELNQFGDLEDAIDMAKEAATKRAGILVPEAAGGVPCVGLGMTETREDFTPVSIIEQFMNDLDAHSSTPRSVTQRDAKAIVTHAGAHHRLMEDLCNGTIETDEDGDNPRVSACRAKCEQAAKRLGAKGVVFSGDPRGCTVKLVFEDGFTNDWGKEGYCVPTSLTNAD